MSAFDRESALYFHEVDTLAADYVRNGYAPMEAHRLAAEAVQRRRREAARTRKPEKLSDITFRYGFKEATP